MKNPKNSKKFNTTEELALMRMSIKTMRDEINSNLDAMLDNINRLLPPEDANRYQKQKNFTKEQRREFLGF